MNEMLLLELCAYTYQDYLKNYVKEDTKRLPAHLYLIGDADETWSVDVSQDLGFALDDSSMLSTALKEYGRNAQRKIKLAAIVFICPSFGLTLDSESPPNPAKILCAHGMSRQGDVAAVFAPVDYDAQRTVRSIGQLKAASGSTGLGGLHFLTPFWEEFYAATTRH